MKFVDTNYFLRFFLNKPGAQHDEARTLFEQASKGIMKLCTSTIVFFEIYWVATSFYGLKKERVSSFLRSILTMEFIELESREALSEALGIYEDSNFDLEDAYNMVFAGRVKASEFMTFDIKLRKKFQSMNPS